jgi:cell division protein FtsW
VSDPVVRHPGEYRWETRLLGVVTATLVVFGVANSYAAVVLQEGTGNGIKQVVGALGGLIVMSIAARVDYRVWRRLAWPFLAVTLLFLLVPLLPFMRAISPTLNGARRWVDLGLVSVQPSEVARLAVVVWCAMLAAKKGTQVREFKHGMMPFLLVLGLVSLLILLQPNMSMAVLTALCGFLILFSAGAKIGHFLLLGVAAIWFVWERIEAVSYRASRLTAFLDPDAAGGEATFQVKQSLIGFGSGGFLGVGFGEGQQKLGYLPYAYNDFLFSTIGEEWGFLGVALVALLFAVYCWLGFRIARTAPDPFGRNLAAGLTALIGVTAVMHMCVSVALIPTTGLSLPFMSYGLSSLGIALAGAGILLSVGRLRGSPAPRSER